MSKPKAFKIQMAQADIEAILERVRAYRWHEMPQIAPDGDRWAYGTDMAYMQELCAYWVQDYDWRAHEAQLNRFSHFRCDVDGRGVHFIQAKSSNPNAPALLLTHGWPGSVYEFMEVIGPLARPEAFGGRAQDGMDVIAPSLPGYAFSDKPDRPLGPKSTAALWDRLMREQLNYDSYIAQGGDWGAVVSSFLGLNHARGAGGGCRAVHLNMYALRSAGAQAQTAEEKRWQESARAVFEWESAYLRLQMTKPQTLSYAMMDSPVGVCAWIVEKFHRWSDRRGAKPGEHIENAFSKDQLLTNVMIYLLTRSFNTAAWFYRGMAEEGGVDLAEGERIEVPVGAALFPREFIPFPPRRMVEAGYNIQRWSEMARGGHFAAMEEPGLFVEDVRAFVRSLAPS